MEALNVLQREKEMIKINTSSCDNNSTVYGLFIHLFRQKATTNTYENKTV